MAPADMPPMEMESSLPFNLSVFSRTCIGIRQPWENQTVGAIEDNTPI